MAKRNHKELMNEFDKEVPQRALTKFDSSMKELNDYDEDSAFYTVLVFRTGNRAQEFQAKLAEVIGTPEDETKDAIFIDGEIIAKALGIELEDQSYEKLHPVYKEGFNSFKEKHGDVCL